MKNGKLDWLQQPDVGWVKVILVFIFWVLLLIGIDRSQFGKDLEISVSRPLDFRIRDFLGKSPVLNQKIKVYAIDDSTVAKWRKSAPDLFTWVKILKKAAKNRPKAIIVDGLFSIADSGAQGEAEVKKALSELASLGVRVYAGAFIPNEKIKYREPLDLRATKYSTELLLDKKDTGDLYYPFRYDNAEEVYGPDIILRGIFEGVGHLMYRGDGKVDLAVGLRHERFIPQLIMSVFEDFSYQNGRFYVNRALIPTFGNGEVVVNFSPGSFYLENIHSVDSLINRSNSKINSGDYVYIMPQFYTGNTDFKLTPFGNLPGGYVHLAVLNSVLNNDWIRPIWIKDFLILCACLFGCLLGASLSGIALAWSLFSSVIICALFVVICFSFLGIMIPWMVPLIGMIVTAFSISIEKSRVADKKMQHIKSCLSGVISDESLNRIAKVPSVINFSAREQVATVMFVDFVGMVRSLEVARPQQAFKILKSSMDNIRSVVHRYDGVVGRNLGDGLLCFFGYSIETGGANFDHADKALQCALDLHNENVKAVIKDGGEGRMVYPLRIGINTSAVFMGNIGSEENVDFTVVGEGVNFAKLLEEWSSNFSILVGNTTKEIVDNSSEKYSYNFQRRFLSSYKEEVERIEVWEVVFDNKDRAQLILAEKLYYDSLHSNLRRGEVRVDFPGRCIINTNVGKAGLVALSRSGMTVQMATHLHVGTLLYLEVNDSSGKCQELLKVLGCEIFPMEIIWASSGVYGFLYGLDFAFQGDGDITENVLELLNRFFNRLGFDEKKVV